MGLLWKSDSRPVSNLPSAELHTRRLTAKMSKEELHRYDQHIAELFVNSVVEDALSPMTRALPSFCHTVASFGVIS